MPESTLDVVLPGRKARSGFTGTADTVYQNLHLVDRHLPDLVAVFAADHIYRMGARQMVDFYDRVQADVSVAPVPVPVPVERASALGIIGSEAGGRIRQFKLSPTRSTRSCRIWVTRMHRWAITFLGLGY